MYEYTRAVHSCSLTGLSAHPAVCAGARVSRRRTLADARLATASRAARLAVLIRPDDWLGVERAALDRVGVGLRLPAAHASDRRPSDRRRFHAAAASTARRARLNLRLRATVAPAVGARQRRFW